MLGKDIFACRVNEPRCRECPEALQSWIEIMAKFVKEQDQNHLLTVGEDGFYSTSEKTWANPQGAGRWAELVKRTKIKWYTCWELQYDIGWCTDSVPTSQNFKFQTSKFQKLQLWKLVIVGMNC